MERHEFVYTPTSRGKLLYLSTNGDSQDFDLSVDGIRRALTYQVLTEMGIDNLKEIKFLSGGNYKGIPRIDNLEVTNSNISDTATEYVQQIIIARSQDLIESILEDEFFNTEIGGSADTKLTLAVFTKTYEIEITQYGDIYRVAMLIPASQGWKAYVYTNLVTEKEVLDSIASYLCSQYLPGGVNDRIYKFMYERIYSTLKLVKGMMFE